MNHYITHKRLLQIASYGSFGLALILISLKLYAWIATDAMSMQASLLDSLLDALASFVNLLAIRHAMKPADKEHRFGHGKIEAMAAQLQSLFISGTAFWLMLNAFHRLFEPQPIEQIDVGIWVTIFAIFSTLILVTFQHYVVKKTKSTAIRADSLHYKSDLFLNLSVLISLGLVHFYGASKIDTVCGLLIAAYIFYSSWTIAREAFDILMDRELPDADIEKIETLVKDHPNVLGFHDLRTRSSGPQQFIQLHLELDATLSLQQAHQISFDVAEKIKAHFPHAEIIIHEDPHGTDRH